METQLVSALMTQTGLSAKAAHSLLQSKSWDLHSALTAYENAKNNMSIDMAAPCTRLQNEWSPPMGIPLENSSYVTTPLRVSLEENPERESPPRPLLLKSQAVDYSDCKKLARGISRATDNLTLVSKARSEFAMDFPNSTANNQYYIETPEYTFTLPDITVYSEDFKKFLEKDLIENSCLVALEQSGRLNWWATNGSCQRLWPLATTGDGNCLLHAASLAMWGFHDRLLTLRGALYGLLSSGHCKESLYRRWRWHQTKLNAQAGFVYEEAEWEREWEGIVAMASTEPRKAMRRRSILEPRYDDNQENRFENATYESLEEIHVLALAHVLRRPIIIIADVMLKDLNGEAMAPIPFGGIYLPLECRPSECHRSPLLLTYDMAHFSALVVMEKETYGNRSVYIPPAVIPLTDSDHQLLPIHFSIDPGGKFVWGKDDKDPNVINKLILSERDDMNMLKEYLDVAFVSSQISPGEEFEIDFSEDEIDKKFIEPDIATLEENDQTMFGNNKSKAAKQLQSVAKQFGSIGKSMSKKIKKNIGSITKMGAKVQQKKVGLTSANSVSNITKSRILCAELRAKRHEYQEEMVRNYLDFAQARFLKSELDKGKQETERLHFENLKLQEQAMLEGPLNCINPGCDQYGTALTSYLCTECFEKQRNNEYLSKSNEDFSPRYDTGNSKFYAETDMESHENIKRLPSVRALNNLDQTLYLSKSTFYNDTKQPSNIMTLSDWDLTNSQPTKSVSPTKKKSNEELKSRSDKTTWAELNASSKSLSTPGETVKQEISNHEENGTKNISSTSTADPLKVCMPSQASIFSPGNSINTQSYNLAKQNSSNGTNGKTICNSAPVERRTNFAPHKHEIKREGIHSAVVSLCSQDGLPYEERGTTGTTSSIRPLKSLYSNSCRTPDCIFYGSPDTDYYCSKCRRERLKSGYL